MGYVLDVAVERPIHFVLSYFSSQKLEPGLRVRVPVGKSLSKGWVLSVRLGEEKGLKKIEEVVDSSPPIPSSFLEFAKMLSFEYCYPLGMTLKLFFSYDYLPPFGELGLKPHREGFNKVIVGSRDMRASYYKKLCLEFLSNGEKVLLIVPQVEDVEDWASRLSFERIYLWFSEMKRKDRKRAWEAARSEGGALFIGTSSLAFLPVKGLGLIIVDDEGSPYLKRISSPYVHARDAVLLRRKIESFSMVLGGAIPSLEAFALLKEGWDLEELLQKLPKYRLVDLRKTRKEAFLSLSVFNKVKANLKSGKKNVLLLNRKAYASYVKCEECGYVPMCSNCGIPLSFYKRENKLRCSYCGHEEFFLDRCSNCRGFFFKVGSPGIEHVKLLLEKKLGENVELWDAESREFKESSLLILGTQSVLQPKVMRNAALACIVLADISLYTSGYRSEEETLRMIYSLADFSPKELYVQTSIPEHPVFKVFGNNSWREFLQKELDKREELRYPPNYSIAVISFEGGRESTLKKRAESVKRLFDGNPYLEVLGPVRRFLVGEKLSLALVVKGKRGELQRELWKNLESGKIKISKRVNLVIDPLEV
ncbi:MAG: hypothetical protein NZ900_01330 [Synergistetes bacterium]|nr:hypothetical protein [Synergistota bacterium]MDW8191569.1 hypothetical protein [Synergistota bacterium]